MTGQGETWTTIESDPGLLVACACAVVTRDRTSRLGQASCCAIGVFTELIQSMGVEGVQVCPRLNILRTRDTQHTTFASSQPGCNQNCYGNSQPARIADGGVIFAGQRAAQRTQVRFHPFIPLSML